MMIKSEIILKTVLKNMKNFQKKYLAKLKENKMAVSTFKG